MEQQPEILSTTSSAEHIELCSDSPAWTTVGSETRSEDSFASPDPTEYSVHIPVLFFKPGAQKCNYTAQVTFDGCGFSTRARFEKHLSDASQRLPNDFDSWGRYPSSPGNVFFIWDFAPQMSITEAGLSLPEYGKTDIAHVSMEEFPQYLRAALTGKIRHIVAISHGDDEEITGPEPNSLSQQQEQQILSRCQESAQHQEPQISWTDVLSKAIAALLDAVTHQVYQRLYLLDWLFAICMGIVILTALCFGMLAWETVPNIVKTRMECESRRCGLG